MVKIEEPGRDDLGIIMFEVRLIIEYARNAFERHPNPKVCSPFVCAW